MKEAHLLETFDVCLGECHKGLDGIHAILDGGFTLRYKSTEPFDQQFGFLFVNHRIAN